MKSFKAFINEESDPFTFHFDKGKEKNYIDNPEQYKGLDKVDHPKVISALEKKGWRGTWLRHDNSLSKYGKENIHHVLKNHNEELENNAKKRFIKKSVVYHNELLSGIHKRTELDFEPLPVHKFNSGNSLLLHKSPNYNRRQSSEYKLHLIGNDLAYARKSNHWGVFHTNVYSNDPYEGDQFNRIGSKKHTWNLKNSNNDIRTSQAGYIKLKDLK